VDLHIHPPIRLRGVVLDKSSTGTALPLSLKCVHRMHDVKRLHFEWPPWFVESKCLSVRDASHSHHGSHCRRGPQRGAGDGPARGLQWQRIRSLADCCNLHFCLNRRSNEKKCARASVGCA
jgi:hypothetical protein